MAIEIAVVVNMITNEIKVKLWLKVNKYQVKNYYYCQFQKVLKLVQLKNKEKIKTNCNVLHTFRISLAIIG